MGMMKRIWMEAEERGNLPPDKGEYYICEHHYDDPNLNKIIRDHAIDGQCSFCGRKTKVCDMHDFLSHVMFRIVLQYEDFKDAMLYSSSGFYDSPDEVIPGFRNINGYVVPDEAEYFDSTDELMERVDLLSGDEEVDEYVRNQFGTEQWISRDMLDSDGATELYNSWLRFANIVRSQRRFTFLAQPDILTTEVHHRRINILDEIHDYIVLCGLCVDIPTGTELYRARRVEEVVADYSFMDLTSPPDKSACANRMSPVGVSMFYASFDKETAKRECTGDEPHIVTGYFKTIRKLKVIDFTRLPMLSFWMEHYEPNHFLHLFHRELVKSLAPDDTNAISYVPSQVFTEYLRYMFKDGKGDHVDGMVYKSAKTNKHNIVLFYDQQASKDVVELVRYKVVKSRE